MKTRVMLVLCALVVSFATSASAALFPSYQVTLGTGLDDVAPSAGQDIVAVYYGYSATHHYFRMDLEGAPAGPTDYAGLYGIYIDADDDTVTGEDGVDWDYIPDDLVGIDRVLDTHFNPALLGYYRSDDHEFYPTLGFTDITTDPTRHEENGVVLEWAILRTELPGDFRFWAVTHDDGADAPTYDIEGAPDPVVGELPPGWVIPEPASMGLMGLGTLGLLIQRRRRMNGGSLFSKKVSFALSKGDVNTEPLDIEMIHHR